MQGSDIVSRITRFLDVVDPIVLLAGLSGLLLIVMLAAFGKRLALFFLLLVTLTLDAANVPALGTGAALARFFMLFVMAAYVLTLRRNPGRPWWLYMGYVTIGLAMTGFADNPMFAIQWGVLTMVSGLAAASLVEFVNSPKQANQLCASFVLCAGFWTALSVSSLGDLSDSQSGARMTGFAQSAGIFVQTGGFLLPYTVWGMMRPWNSFLRLFCGGLALVMVAVLIYSGQRTGTFAGIIACMPMLARAQFGKLLFGLGVIGGCALAVVKLASLNENQAAFVSKRFMSTDTSGRTEIWTNTLPILLESPILGRGFGTNKELRGEIGNTVHNMYLQIWYDAGILGVILFVWGGILAGWQAFMLIFRTKDPQLNEMARLTFGVLLASAANGMFATGAASPSDFATMNFLVGIVLTYRLVALHQESRTASPFAMQPWMQPGLATAPQMIPAGDPQSHYNYWYWPRSETPNLPRSSS